MSARTGTPLLPPLRRSERGYAVLSPGSTLTLGFIEHGPNMHGWGWTVGLGWHTGLPTVGAALDALLADPAFGVDVHGEGRPSANGDSGADGAK